MKAGEDIKDYIPLIGTDILVEYTPNQEKDWYRCRIIGINLYEKTLLLVHEDRGNDYFHSFWVPLYFQLNKNFPKYFKVRFIQ